MYHGLCVLNTKTGITFKAFPKSELQRMNVKWSPDGKRFVYMSKTITPILSEHIFVCDFQPTPFWKPTAAEDVAPAVFSILGNYPNPFNPTTTISFTLPSSGKANLSVYSVTGQKVQELVNGPLSAGAHAVVWDGRDAAGKPVSSGVYLSRLNQENRTTANRTLLAK